MQHYELSIEKPFLPFGKLMKIGEICSINYEINFIIFLGKIKFTLWETRANFQIK